MSRIEVVPNMAGGKGQVRIKHLLEKEALGEKCRLYAEVTIYPGSSLGYHEHQGESESYYILSGEAIYSDDNKKYPVKAGDVTLTTSGHGHGLEPTGSEPLVFMALILKD